MNNYVSPWMDQGPSIFREAAARFHGGYGCMNEYVVCRMFADARVQRIYGDTNEIMKELISRAL